MHIRVFTYCTNTYTFQIYLELTHKCIHIAMFFVLFLIFVLLIFIYFVVVFNTRLTRVSTKTYKTVSLKRIYKCTVHTYLKTSGRRS